MLNRLQIDVKQAVNRLQILKNTKIGSLMMIDELKNLADTLNINKDYIPRARRISMNLSKIEAILKTGFTLNSLVRVLNENGFEITFKSFKNDVYQARKKLKQGKDTIKNQNEVLTLKESSNIQSKLENELENEKPKYERRQTIKQIQAEAALEFKELERNAKKQHSKAVQYQRDKLEKRKNEQENKNNIEGVL